MHHPIQVIWLCAQLVKCPVRLNKLYTKLSDWYDTLIVAQSRHCSYLAGGNWGMIFEILSAKETLHGGHESWSNQHGQRQ